jgi:hypothetical protein
MQKVPVIDAIESAQSANDSMPEMDALLQQAVPNATRLTNKQTPCHLAW